MTGLDITDNTVITNSTPNTTNNQTNKDEIFNNIENNIDIIKYNDINNYNDYDDISFDVISLIN